jgi:hypothetical protein
MIANSDDLFSSYPDLEKLDIYFSDLFSKYALSVNSKIFLFGELELYYHNDIKYDGELCFKRPRKKAGEIFFHKFGMDICFPSTEDKYGGVLIRTLCNDTMTYFGPRVSRKSVLLEERQSKGIYCVQQCSGFHKLVNTIRIIGENRNQDEKDRNGDI